MSAEQNSEYHALSAVDGRDARLVHELRPHFSEFGLMKNRTRVEAAWLTHLSQNLPDIDRLGDTAMSYLTDIRDGAFFNDADMSAIKAHEAKTNHDMKAVELALKDRLAVAHPELAAFAEMTHFGLTSEDANNLAEGIGFEEARSKVMLPALNDVEKAVTGMAHHWAHIPLLGRTHGQPATPTTLGKEFAVFSDRIRPLIQDFGAVAIKGKLNGATGSYNAMKVVYPEVHWPSFSREFVTSLGLEFNPTTTQIEPHDWMAQYLGALKLASYPLVDLSKDTWDYISRDLIAQRKVEGEVGSSTMPQKINPINFEKAESNFDSFITLADGLSRKLTQSRLQRDLSDSSSKRVIGVAMAHELIALKSLKRGLGNIDPNEPALAVDLDAHWEVLTEPIQQMMRRYGVPGGYDLMKEASRGRKIGKEEYLAIVETLAGDARLPADAVERLRTLTPATYIGYAPDIAMGSA